MKKKIFSIALIITLLFSSLSVFATETTDATLEDITLEPGESLEEILNTPLVDSAISSEEAERLISEMGMEVGVVYYTGNKIIADEAVTLKDTNIDGNLAIFAQTVDLDGVEVNGDVAIFAQKINISNVTVYNGASVLAAETINVNSYSTEGNIYAAAQTVSVNAIARRLYVAAETLQVSPESTFKTVYNVSEILPEQEAPVVTVKTTADTLKDKLFQVAVVLVKTAIVAGFIFLFKSEFINKTKTDNIVKYIGFSALKGAGWTILIPICAIGLCITGVAAGVGIVTILLYVILFWATVPFVSIAVMNVIAKDEDSKWKKYGLTICVALAIAVLRMIPYVGPIIAILVAFAGMGIAIGSLKNNDKCECKKGCECKKEVEVKAEENK